jgi:hydrogenase nickel incorporation protein HypA/HybF
MHELTICENLIDLALAVMGERRVTRQASIVTVQIGRLTAVVPDSLRFYFGVLAQGTLLESAELRVDMLDLRTRCESCVVELSPDFPSLSCSRCGGSVEVLSGRELRLVSIDFPEETK